MKYFWNKNKSFKIVHTSLYTNVNVTYDNTTKDYDK